MPPAFSVSNRNFCHTDFEKSNDFSYSGISLAIPNPCGFMSKNGLQSSDYNRKKLLIYESYRPRSFLQKYEVLGKLQDNNIRMQSYIIQFFKVYHKHINFSQSFRILFLFD